MFVRVTSSLVLEACHNVRVSRVRTLRRRSGAATLKSVFARHGSTDEWRQHALHKKRK